jgi:putative transcriptional regulator
VNHLKKNQWLIQKRNDLDMTQEEVAKEAKIDRTYYTKLENGATPSVKVAKSVSTVLGFDWTRFFEQNCDEKSQNEQTA